MKLDTGNETERFEVIELDNGKTVRYKVLDRKSNRYVRYGYVLPVQHETKKKPATQWMNYYSARGYCQKMQARVKGRFGEQANDHGNGSPFIK